MFKQIKGNFINFEQEKFCQCKGSIQKDPQSLLTNNQAIQMYENYRKNNKSFHQKISIKKSNKSFNNHKQFRLSVDKSHEKLRKTRIYLQNQQSNPLKIQRIISYKQFQHGLKLSEKQNPFRYKYLHQKYENQQQGLHLAKTGIRFTPFHSKQISEKQSHKLGKFISLKKAKKSIAQPSLIKDKAKKEDPENWLFGDNKINSASHKNILKTYQNIKANEVNKYFLSNSKSLTFLKTNEEHNLSSKESENGQNSQKKYNKKNIQNNLIDSIIQQEEENTFLINSQINKVNDNNSNLLPLQQKSSKSDSFFLIDDLPEKTITENSIGQMRMKQKNSVKNNLKKIFDSDLIQSSFQFKDPSQKSKITYQDEKQQKNENKNQQKSQFTQKRLNIFYSVNLKKRQCNQKLSNMIKKPIQSIRHEQIDQQKQISQVLLKYQQYCKRQIKNSRVGQSICNLTKINKIHIKGFSFTPSDENLNEEFSSLRDTHYSYKNLTNLNLTKHRSANVQAQSLILN